MLKVVTITGACDTTPIKDLVALSQEFPFVEWAILVSRSSMGHGRWPGRRWIAEFSEAARVNRMNVAMHLCGAWVRDLLVGELMWTEIPFDLLEVAQRIQINTHAEPHYVRDAMIPNLMEHREKTFIVQLDGVNSNLVYIFRSYSGLTVHGLFDTSHGAGVLPQRWPLSEFTNTIKTGYAGGLGPENVVDQLAEIEKVASPGGYWIDMEGRVRADDEQYLDLAKVRSVLQQTKPFVVPGLLS